MNHLEIAAELSRNKEVFKNLFNGIEPAQFIWRPQPDKWCLLEILCHLYDEEREDFRARVKHILDTPNEPMPKIDPQAWVKERFYMDRDYADMLEKFIEEREASVDYLENLENIRWENVYVHPKVGPIPASLIMHNWIAHDYLHIRQIIATKYQYLKSRSTDPLDYAGEW